MITVGRNTGKQPFYNMAEFLCDYESDVADLPTNRGPGSKAYVVETGNTYVLNSQHQWVLQPVTSGTASGGDIIYDGTNIDGTDSSNNLIYDGTNIDSSVNSSGTSESEVGGSGTIYDGGNV